MKKIININLSSRLIPIEDSAYEILRQYLDSLRRYFSKEEGAEEIVGDIESRIAEIFQDKIRKGAHCITDEDVQAIKTSMGTPEQFVEEDGDTTGSSHHKSASEPFAPYIRPRKRFYRDPDGKVLGGVCSGLGAYFNVDPLVFRIIFAIAAIGLWGGGILLYFILWFATPEAVTAAEKLEMRGERVDLNNIKATVQEEMNTFRSRMERMGDDVRNFSEGRGKQYGRDAGTAIEGFFKGLANVIVFIAKGFFLFLAVVILFVLVVGLIMSAVFSAVLIPVKDLLLDNGVQTMLFWPSLALLVGIPILSLVAFLIRKMAGIKQQHKYAGYTLGFFWLMGVVFSVWLSVSLAQDFKARYNTPEPEIVNIVQPEKGRLIVKKARTVLEMEEINLFDGNLRVLDDTVIIDDIRIQVLKSETDSFAVEVERSSRGKNWRQAEELAREIYFGLEQKDSVLYIPSGFSIPRNSKYRNQKVTVRIRVPVGKHIVIDREVRHHYSFIRNWREEWWDDRYNWDRNNDQIDIRMTPDGWERKDLHERKQEENSRADTTAPRNEYRYRGPGARPEQQNTTPVEDSSSKDAEDKKSLTLAVASFMFQNTFEKLN